MPPRPSTPKTKERERTLAWSANRGRARHKMRYQEGSQLTVYAEGCRLCKPMASS